MHRAFNGLMRPYTSTRYFDKLHKELHSQYLLLTHVYALWMINMYPETTNREVHCLLVTIKLAPKACTQSKKQRMCNPIACRVKHTKLIHSDMRCLINIDFVSFSPNR